MGLFNDIDPIFFYHKSVKPLLAMGFNGVVTPSGESLKQEVQELRLQLETEHADREEIEAELSELKQNSVPAATLSEKLAPDAATILSQFRARRKKSKIDLADLEVILEIIGSGSKKIITDMT